MSLKKALNVLIVALWVCAQTAMTYAHDASGAPIDGAHKTTEVHKTASSDCLNHAESKDDSKNHHSGSSLEQCCSIACSIVGPLATLELIVVTADLDFALDRVHALIATNLGLPTPPPNTTF